MSEDAPNIEHAPGEEKSPHGGLRFALDFGPLLTFFLANHFLASEANPSRGPMLAIAAFMVAITLAIVIAKWKFGRVSPMMWISAILVIGFGAIALMLGDPKFIQIKATAVYLLFAAILFGGLLRGKALLKYLLDHAFTGVSDIGWRKLSRNWGLFFLAMAALNELLRLQFSFDTWLTLKVWGVSALSLIFTFAQIPMLMRHGLKLEDDAG